MFFVKQILSVFVILALLLTDAKADSFLLPINAIACENIKKDISRAETRYNAYDKAVLIAIKNTPYMQEISKDLDDYQYSIIAYKISDNIIRDIEVITLQDDENKICVEVNGEINKSKIVDIIKKEGFSKLSNNIDKIAKNINKKMPVKTSPPSIYIKKLTFYNNTTTNSFSQKLKDLLSLETSIIVTDNEELADYLLLPELKLSKMEKIDDKNSKYSMSVSVSIQTLDKKTIISAQQNRYIIIENKENKQEIANKLLNKLLDECIKKISPNFKDLKR